MRITTDSNLHIVQKVPVVFATGVTGVGRALDPSCDDDDVRAPERHHFPLLTTYVAPALDFLSSRYSLEQHRERGRKPVISETLKVK
jgi:hypothetical protein